MTGICHPIPHFSKWRSEIRWGNAGLEGLSKSVGDMLIPQRHNLRHNLPVWIQLVCHPIHLARKFVFMAKILKRQKSTGRSHPNIFITPSVCLSESNDGFGNAVSSPIQLSPNTSIFHASGANAGALPLYIDVHLISSFLVGGSFVSLGYVISIANQE